MKRKPMLRFALTLLILYSVVIVFVYFRQRAMLYYPTHLSLSSGLVPWSNGGQIIGYCHAVSNPRAIWLMTHGNAGQAAHRDYVLSRLSDQDSLYVLEYPGYGARPGRPSLESMNQAAAQAYELLRVQNPGKPVCVLGESIGSGPACALAAEKVPPDKIVLVVPFDTLASVAAGHFPFLPVRWMLRDAWDNVAALKQYAGPVEIFGARDDNIVPMKHAQALAGQIPRAHFTAIPGGHNDWADQPEVTIR